MGTTGPIGWVCYVLLKWGRAEVGYTGVNLFAHFNPFFRAKFNPQKCPPLEHLARKEAEVTCVE